ncbi:UDP-3-O-(3-hydroxymyristoyl)glucosamine N-acyltransferase [Desulfosediminicola flagellatus]|uniref:UDP-3-O-(3-hydroxymyristoyl)glucosamine N-acyltransferase n=1 Tax=Desulfosediminicola flagellatus TaxID=2569541 RepID=UPI0010AC98BF|nr:UDP-3-O-(3-hydroxymyristoyl)glucosamine N-acyltransferase [Desulfosediminicola flagellatus]
MITKTLRLDAVAEMVDGELIGNGDVTISNIASIETAGPDDLAFLAKVKEAELLQNCKAAVALVPLTMGDVEHMPVIKVKNPYLASAIVHNALLEKEFKAEGIHERAYIGSDCTISKNISIGPLVAVGNRVTIGERVSIEPGTVIGDDVIIGDDTHLKANVTVAYGCVLGKKVIIHSGTVIGSDGYGYATDDMGNHVKRPQVGKVKIDDDVEIGSNVSIDRGTFGDTWIQSGAKIDNQVQIGHNVVVGPNSLIVAQVGIAGSTTLGRNVVLAGRSALNGHIHLGDQAMVAGGSGVHGSLEKGAKVGGYPAIPITKWAKANTIFAKLPEIYSEFRKLKKAVAALQEKLANN